MPFLSTPIRKLIYSYCQPYEIAVYSCIAKDVVISTIVDLNHMNEHLKMCALIGWKDGMLVIWIKYFAKNNSILRDQLIYLAENGYTRILKEIKPLITEQITYNTLMYGAVSNDHVNTLRLIKKWFIMEQPIIKKMLIDLFKYSIEQAAVKCVRKIHK
jgi:hypothetical protein